MGTPADVYRCLTDTIEARLRAVAPDGVADDHAGKSPSEEVDAEVLRLEADKRAVQLHSQVIEQQVTYGAANFCQECGEPAPCETIRGLAGRYDCAAT